MLWLKTWLEIRWRILFALVFMIFPTVLRIVSPAPPTPIPIERSLGVIAGFWAIAGLMLAGSGIKTQLTMGRAARGGHKSTHFTLSLPVSRFHLLAVRTALGMLAVVILLIAGNIFFLMTFPDLELTPALTLEHILVVCVCASAFYSLGLLLSTFLDEMYQMWIGMVVIFSGSFYSIGERSLPAAVDFFRAMGQESPLLTQTLPWTAMAGSIGVSILLFVAALKVVRTREY